MKSSLLNPRKRSLLRGSLLVLLSLAIALLLSDFPHNRANPFLILPAIAAIFGTADTVRCMQRRWSFYHGGVLLCIYMDLMALCMILFFLLYPYTHWITSSQ
ncbi:permease [Granulicella sp. L60]|uniref:permease n=1 Tax=Granulicella sp. L60 TaxID=1641866 RepID=UPI00131B97CB|nr:permease [Granulicella sp. L60]